MKKMIYATVLWLFTAAQLFSQNHDLQIKATGTGNTTGHIADIRVFNPGSEAKEFILLPCIIPSDGHNQTYIVVFVIRRWIQPGSMANIPVNGYCIDIFSPPVPKGHEMPSFWTWVQEKDIPESEKNPLDYFRKASKAFDELKKEGLVSTPFSSQPDKEKEASIQHSLWIEHSDGKYTKDQFRENTIKQFEAATGKKFEESSEEVRQGVEAGVTDFWTVFEAVGKKVKVVVVEVEPGSQDGPIEISVEDKFCECGTVSLKAKVFIKDPFQPEVACKDLVLNSGSNVRDTIEYKVIPNYEIRMELEDIVTRCTECQDGECAPKEVEISFDSEGMKSNIKEEVTPEEGKAKMAARTVTNLGRTKKAEENPVRLFITVTYVCASDPCKSRSDKCKAKFEVTIPRK
ncbi:MAG: hypothetical protein R3A50_12800 [Saprospiraceae bacterium]